MSNIDHEITELKQRLSTLESKIDFLFRRMGIETPLQNPVASPEVIALVRSGEKVKAIKLFIQQTGAGLNDAKDFIESLEAKYGPSVQHLR